MKKISIKDLFIKRTFQMILASIIIIIVGYCLIKNNTNIIDKDTHINWQVYSNTNSGFEFRYPKTFSGNVWAPITWPALVTVVPKNKNPIEYGCPHLKNIDYSLEKIQGDTNNGMKYFLYKGNDAGAGSLYSLYCYVIQGKTDYYVLDFAIRSHSGCGDGNCGAYCGTPFEQECKDIDRIKDIEMPLNKVIFTFKTIKK